MALNNNRHETVASIKQQILTSYPMMWENMIKQWKGDGCEDACWLMYSANYLFRTKGVRWAIDPFTAYSRTTQTPVIDAVRDLQIMDFIVLTHEHADHLDLDLIRKLRNFPIQWIIPQYLLPFLETCNLDPSKVIIAKPLEPIRLAGIVITPFPGLHRHTTPDGISHGVEAMGYHVASGKKTWLFPGDTRSYEPGKIPKFSSPDVVFAHLWLGKSSADNIRPNKVEEFVRFFTSFNPRKVICTHFYEIGRPTAEFWDMAHFEQVQERMCEILPSLVVQAATMGDMIQL